MRALVMSDSHGDASGLRLLLEKAWNRIGPGRVDAYIHCGDGARDLRRLETFVQAHDPGAALYTVRGNCDGWISDTPDEDVLSLGGVRVYLCHGHRWHVKSTLTYLEYAAQERECAVALYGHTHQPAVDTGRVLLINPGSAADDRMALLEVEEGRPRVRMLNLSGMGPSK